MFIIENVYFYKSLPTKTIYRVQCTGYYLGKCPYLHNRFLNWIIDIQLFGRFTGFYQVTHLSEKYLTQFLEIRLKSHTSVAVVWHVTAQIFAGTKIALNDTNFGFL